VRAEHLAAGRFTPARGAAFNVDRPYCRVEIVATPTPASDIRIELWLPDAAQWNGRFWGLGNGSFGGQIPHRSLAVRVAAGYAVVATDTGHQADPSDARWALGQPEKVVDFGHRSVHLAALHGKRAAEAYFGRKPERAYFSAYSNGGRQALMLAQRYPEDYDGIIAGAPAPDLTGIYAAAAEFMSGLTAAPEARLSAAQADLLAAAARTSCDSQDGVRDGVLENPLRCRFDPAALACRSWPGSGCLSPAQVAGVRRLYDGLATASGRPPAGGLARGSEPGWHALFYGDAPGQAGLHGPVTGFFRHLVLDDPTWELAQFRVDREAQRAQHRLGSVLDATDPDISRFVARGGKLILWHGWNDAVVSPAYSVAYHAGLLRTLGPQAAAKSVRLFMAPGVEHGIGGPGPDRFGQFSGGDGDPERSLGAAMRRWVEQGVAPEQVLAVRYRSPNDPASGVGRSRPLCAWPKVAVYRGAGSPDDAQNFFCARQALADRSARP
jgi:feruloyl esterase